MRRLLGWIGGPVLAAALLVTSGPAWAQTLPGFGKKPGPRTDAPAEAVKESLPAVEPGREALASAKASSATVAPGGEVVIAVVLEHAPGWHTWPSKAPDVLPADIAEFAIRTHFEIDEPPSWMAPGPTQWPAHSVGHAPDFATGGTRDVQLYQGRAIGYIPVRIAADAPAGPATVRIFYEFQACNDTMCQMPMDGTLEVPLTIAPDGPAAFAVRDDDFVGFDRTVFQGAAFAAPAPAQVIAPPSQAEPAGTPEVTAQAPVGSSFFGLSLGGLHGPAGIAILLVLSALGGALLNLTPCVLPVIPIKVMTLTRHASAAAAEKGDVRGHSALYLGFWMAVGVIAFWVAIGLPVALLNFGDPSRIFGFWYVTFGIGVLIAVMALGLMGLFTLTLPQSVYMVNPNADTASGSFLFGAMTAVLGLPCFGFVAGALLAAATKWGAWTTLGVFAAIGVGMAAPYFILSAKPSLLKAVPKTGPASELVKQVMGLLLLAAGAYFIGSGLIGLVAEQPWVAKQLHWWAVAVFAATAGVWLVVRTAQITKRPAPTAVFAVVGVLIGGAAVAYALQATRTAKGNYLEQAAAREDSATIVPGVWTEYTPERFEAARAADMVVVLDFTAEWCLNCKALKAAVLNREPVKPLLHDDNFALLTVDLTSRTAPGWDLLKSLGQTGIPLLVIYGPGLPADEPWMSNAYTPDQVEAAVAKARGDGGAGSRVSARP